MELLEAIKKRRSIRRFDPERQVTEEQIEYLLEAARWAPSAGNLESFYFVIVKDRLIKERLVDAAGGQEFIAQAPLVFIACANMERCASRYGERGAELYSVQDATIAAQNLWLAATELGLGVCWVGAFDEETVHDSIYLSKGLRPIALLPVGYPLESPKEPSRRPISQIARKV